MHIGRLSGSGNARRLVGSEGLHAPHLIDAEVVSALRRPVLAGTLNAEDGLRCMENWSHLAVIRYAADLLLQRLWELRGGISAYDAMYVALAELLDCALVTADARLSRASGLRCSVDHIVVEVQRGG